MEPSTNNPYSFAVYALSRGKGIPERTRNIFNGIVGTLEQAKKDGKAMNIGQSRIGIEGETRLCVEFNDSQFGMTMAAQIQNSIQNVDLLSLKIEQCSTRTSTTLNE